MPACGTRLGLNGRVSIYEIALDGNAYNDPSAIES